MRQDCHAPDAATPCRVLIVTNMYPSAELPRNGIFIQRQVESLRARGVVIDVLLQDRLGRGMGVYRGTAAAVRRALATGHYDLIHCRYGGFLALGAWLGRGRRPFVLSLCGSDLLGEPQLGGLRAVAAWAGSVASLWVARRAQHVFVMSPEMRDRLVGVDPARVSIAASGVDTSRFRRLDRSECRRRLGWDGPGAHILFGGYRHAPRKRLDLAEAAVAAVAAAGRQVELHVPEGVAGDDMPLWLNAANLLLLTSTHEGSPNIVKEALACDVPVVSTDVGDVRARLAGVAGCRVVDGEPAAIAAAIDTCLAANPDGRIDGQAAIADVTLEQTAARIEAVYFALKRRRASS